jgi:hypothetical protein
MKRRESMHLQLELLRMRGQIERTQVAASMFELKTSVRRIGAIAASVASVGSALGGAGGAAHGLAGSVLGTVGSKSLWASVALVAVRAMRRHPVAAAALTMAALAVVGWWVGHRQQSAAAAPGSE